jgi:DNA polymerase III delta prime subunit
MINTTPQKTADMVFANASTADLITDIFSGNYPFPASGKTALCLFGNYGTGKTTYASIFCSELELAKSSHAIVANPMLVSCDKTENITQLLNRCIASANVLSFNHSGYHYFIFDEVDNLTAGAQRALKSFLNRNDIACVLTTNYLDKVDKGLLNRCVTLNFNAGSPHQVKRRVQHLLQQEGLAPLSDELIDEIIQNSDGAWRDIIPVAFRAARKQKPLQPKRSISLVK